MSLRSSMLKYREENGRIYHAMGAGGMYGVSRLKPNLLMRARICATK